MAKLAEALVDNTWFYHDNLYPPGEEFRFYDNGTFHDWKWRYRVDSPQSIRVTYNNFNKDIVMKFNDDISKFTGEFTGPDGRRHKITGTRR